MTQADRLLRRITTLHAQFSDDERPSRLERDLMLGYLRDLYEVYAQEADKPAPTTKSAPRPPAQVEQADVQEQYPTDQPIVPGPPPAAPPSPKTPPPAAPPPVPDAPVPPPPAPALTAHTAVVAPVDDRPAPNPPQPSPAPNLSPEVEELFKATDQNGLANRMGHQRVTDLNRALSINNRVLFANKLFGGNEELNRALKELNLKGSMANAKPTLVDLAQQHQWAKEDRRETAREFIDLVRRRYA